MWRFLRSSWSVFVLCACVCVVSCVKRHGKACAHDASDTTLSDAKEKGFTVFQPRESSLSTQPRDSVKCDYYYFEEDSSASTNKMHWEDEIIRIEQTGGRVKGTFWVTSDEFASAREGYLPGFTVLEMQCLTICGDSISFLLDSYGCLFFSSPVDVSVGSDKEAEEKGYQEWLQSPKMFADSILYVGTISGDTLFLDETKNRWSRKFVRMDEEQVKRFDRKVDTELEEENRREYWRERL